MYLHQGAARPSSRQGQVARSASTSRSKKMKKIPRPSTLEDRKVRLENDLRSIQENSTDAASAAGKESKVEGDQMRVREVKEDDRLADGTRRLVALDADVSNGISMTVTNTVEDAAAKRRALVVDKGSTVIRWARDHLRLAMEDRFGQGGGITATAIEYAYRRFYLQVDRLADSCFFEEIADRIYDLPPKLGNDHYADADGDSYDQILVDMSRKVEELRGFEPGILDERSQVQFKHDTLVGKYQRTFEARLRVERKKREIFYHVQGRLTDCLTAIVSATTRAGYPAHKGGQRAMRGECAERKIEVVRRADRRERQATKFTDKTSEMHEMKSHADVPAPPNRRALRRDWMLIAPRLCRPAKSLPQAAHTTTLSLLPRTAERLLSTQAMLRASRARQPC